MSRQKRMFAVLLSLVFSLLVMSSISYTAENADHICNDRNHCAICYQIQVSNHALKKLIPVAIFTGLVSFLYAVIRVIPVPVELFSTPTLVSLKVKLSN